MDGERPAGESPVDTGELIATGASDKAEECPHTLILGLSLLVRWADTTPAQASPSKLVTVNSMYSPLLPQSRSYLTQQIARSMPGLLFLPGCPPLPGSVQGSGSPKLRAKHRAPAGLWKC